MGPVHQYDDTCLRPPYHSLSLGRHSLDEAMSQQAPSSGAIGSASLSLIELRRHLIRRAGMLTQRARTLRARGDAVMARRLQAQAQRLLEMAREVDEDDSLPTS